MPLILKRLCYNKDMLKKTSMEGFTLVELSLSMVFIGILSVLVVFIINNTVSAYRRGLTLGQVNTVGMEIVDDMRSAVQNSSVGVLVNSCNAYEDEEKQKCKEDDAYNFVSVTKMGNVKVGKDEPSSVPIYGAFCTGAYSYIWNSGYFEDENAEIEGQQPWAKFKYLDIDGEEETVGQDKPFRLLKIKDNTLAVCASAMKDDKYELPELGIGNEFSINDINLSEDDLEEVLVADNSNKLAIYDLEVAVPVRNSTNTNAFYSVSFILGTINGGANIMARGNSCKAPAEHESGNFNYCAINKFNFATQVNGGSI